MADPKQAARKTAALARAGRALQELGSALVELAEDEQPPAAPRTSTRPSTRDRLRGVTPNDTDRQRATRELRRKGLLPEDKQ